MDEIEDLEAARARVLRELSSFHDVMRRRDEKIREASGWGLGVPSIMQATGLSRARVYGILARYREGK